MRKHTHNEKSAVIKQLSYNERLLWWVSIDTMRSCHNEITLTQREVATVKSLWLKWEIAAMRSL